MTCDVFKHAKNDLQAIRKDGMVGFPVSECFGYHGNERFETLLA